MSAPKRSILLVAVTLVAVVTSGCMGDQDGRAMSFEEAMAAPGPVFTPVGQEENRLKLLEPASPEPVATGPLDIRFVLFDQAKMAPVTDASFIVPNKDGCGSDHSFCAQHTDMGHGTSPESSPVHEGDGLYTATTTISMPGNWSININPQLADGRVVAFDVPITTRGS